MTPSRNGIAAWLGGFLPHPPTTHPLEWGRATLGASLGVLLSFLLCSQLFGQAVALAVLGPLGASAVLLFAVSSGALSQPWSIIGSYLSAVLVAGAVAHWLGHGLAAVVLALGGSLLLMCLLRCLHPPGVALALCVVLGNPALSALGFGVIVPVLLNALCLLGWALLFNNLTGARYPRRPAPGAGAAHGTADPAPGQRLGITADDLTQALANFGGFVDVTREDLQALLLHSEQYALRRRMGALDAARVMSRDLRWATPQTSVDQALQMLQHHHLKALPVQDAAGRLVGIVTLSDLIEQLRRQERGSLLGYLGRRGEATVAQVMSQPVVSVSAATHVAELMPLLSDGGLHCLPVTEQGRLVGIVSQTDLIAALQRELLERAA